MTICDEIEIETLERTRSSLSKIIKLLLFLMMQGVLVTFVGFVALFVSFEPVWSDEAQPSAVIRPNDARSGSLLLKTDDGYSEATRLGVDVDLTVSGPTVRARVTQIFRNPTQNWMEAKYVYPLPPGGAVDTLKMVVGDRVMVGDIKERQQARIIYEQARANGQTAAQISAPAKPCWCRSNTRSRCSSPAMNSRCACRWWSRRDITRRPWYRASICAPMAAAGVRAPSIRCRIATAFRLRCSTPPNTVR
jgi:hypothetical protein